MRVVKAYALPPERDREGRKPIEALKKILE